MRAALIFPPQWDPRQPPLAPAALAGTLGAAGVETRIFDLNIALYRRLLQPVGRHGVEDFLLKRLLDPHSLGNAESYLQTCQQAQKIFDERFDPRGTGRLFWDTCGGLTSVLNSKAWQAAISSPDKLPFVRHLESEIAAILAWAPDVIGISAISDTQLPAALALAATIRPALPKSRIIFGGNALTYRRSLLADQPWLRSTVDTICLGDGEPLTAALLSSASLSELPNALSWNKDGKPCAGTTILHALGTSVAPDFSGFPLHEYLTPHLVIPVETARGCPWGRCAFCIHPVRAATGRPLYRPKPVTRVAAEIKNLFAAGHRRFMLVDEALPPARLRELSDLFASLPEPVAWIGYARLDAGHDRAGFARARAAGCRKLFIGVESGSDRILARFHKGVDAARARRVLLDAAAAGLAVHSFLMTGFPGEDENDRQATLDLLADVWPAFDPFGVSFDLFPLSGELETDLMADPERFGWQAPQRDSRNDLVWQFPLMSGPAAAESLTDFKTRIHALADAVLGPAFGLRHAGLAQDCLHLLLLEARATTP
ncbi:MAG: hypothetical protein CVV42_00590 [Candidatus Riflebacteria bacterium HGW-Riflebacteria-2]|jgi:hypothetical protein|nr:MAG: hypothetical protein CVV42_00590 [Candidatus Riflebacteria bacterium HGW-Riflebacteria-2]